VKRKRALLRNGLPRDEFEAKCAGLGSEFHSFPVLNAALTNRLNVMTRQDVLLCHAHTACGWPVGPSVY